MTESQIQIKLEKLVVWSSSLISLRQKYVGYSKRTLSIYWYVQREITNALPYSIHTDMWAIKLWHSTLIISESKMVIFSDHGELRI